MSRFTGPRGRPDGASDPALVIGYGNSLRRDDGAGWHAAGLLADDPRLGDARVLVRHQLTPELAEDISAARVVVLIDARDGGGPPGTISIHRVGQGGPAAPAWSHHLDPAALVRLADELYGGTPPVFLVSVTGASFGVGDRLSRAVRRALPEVAATVAHLMDEHTGPVFAGEARVDGQRLAAVEQAADGGGVGVTPPPGEGVDAGLQNATASGPASTASGTSKISQ
jgi:hydrogenase maturation protease